MKKHNVIKVVLISFLVVMLLSWIFPAAYYSGQYQEQGRMQMGLFDLFNYPLTAFTYFGSITLFIILVGGFYGVLYKIPAYRIFLERIAGLFRGKEKVGLAIIVLLIALLVSICGAHISLALFIPLIVSVVLLMGYDKIVAALVTVGGISAGLIGTTYASDNLSVLTQALSLKFGYQPGVRFVLLLVAVVLVLFNTFMYIKTIAKSVKIKQTVKNVTDEVKEEVAEEIKKVENKVRSSKTSTKKSTGKKTTKKTAGKKSTKSKNNNKAALKDNDIIVVAENVMEDTKLVPKGDVRSHSIWPMVVCFALLFILFVLAFVSWGDTGFKIKVFTDITTNVTKFEIFKFPIFSKLLGQVNAFGTWTLTDLFLPMFLILVLLMVVYSIRLDDAFDGFVEGVKKALAPALVSILVYSVLVASTYHPFQMVLYKNILGWTKGFNIITTSLVAILASIFNVDIAYTFNSVLPYYVATVTKADKSLVGIIFQSMYGLTTLVGPTSLVLMGILAYLNVSYKEWLKNVWKLAVELLVVLLIVFIILASI